MLLINPPVVKPCEPPPGIAKLSGLLGRLEIPHELFDANLEGLLNLLNGPVNAQDVWTRRALRNRNSHLSALSSAEGYASVARYDRAVRDVNRLLEKSIPAGGIRLSLTNYEDASLSPVRSRDLIRASEAPETNPFYPYLRKRLLAFLEQDQPGVVGLSLNYLSQALCAFSMIGILKRESPGTKLVLGGGLITSWMKRLGWTNPFEGWVDYTVAGAGEGPLLSILGQPAFEGASAPDYGHLSKGEYLSPGFILPYSASSGCYWRKCSFCPETAEGNPYRPIPPERVIQDLGSLIRNTNPVLIHFLDNAMSPALLMALAERPLRVPWYGFSRITHHFADRDFCVALRQSGCIMLELGLESGDPQVLLEMRKGIDLETASLALKNLKDAGIGVYVYLLFGTPAETPERARRTLQFTVKHSRMIDFLNLALFNMPSNGPDAEKFESTDFYEGDLSLYKGFTHPKGWDRAAVRQFLDREFKRNPAIAAILRRSPPFFTSNHAPFLRMFSER